MEAPCKNCERVGCGTEHNTCPKYREYQEYLRIKREQRLKALENYCRTPQRKNYRLSDSSPLKSKNRRK